MSELPTLLRSGFIIPPKDTSDKQQEIIKNTISIDYILRIIADMIPNTSNFIKNQPQTFGDKFIVLKSDTGSGKSTVLPVALYNSFFQYTQKNIIVTQPRILTAIDIPSTIIPFSPHLILGKNIGYNTGPFKLPLQDRGIIFSTIGILSQELIMNTAEEFMQKYQFIIIDEIHQRDLEADQCLYLLKKLIMNNYKNNNCPVVILMSATFDEEIFIKYFEIPQQNFIQVIGKTFPIKETFTTFSISNYIEYATLKAQKIHIDNFDDFAIDNMCDIIIFVKDSGIGKKIYNAMHLFNANVLSKTNAHIANYSTLLETQLNNMVKTGGVNQKYHYVLPILLDTTNFTKGGLEYQNLFSSLDIISTPIWKVTNDTIDITTEPITRVIASRRIIISTNLAETGITIPTLKYCIDTGLQLSAEFYPEYGCFALISKPVSYGSAMQRRGRVGRKSMGYWYPCYTKETFKVLSSVQLASIIVNDTTELLLTVLIREKDVTIVQELYASRLKYHNELEMFQMHKLHLNLGSNWYTIKNKFKTNISAIDFIELPSVQSLQYSVEKLHILGFLDDNYDVTVTGYFASKFRFISLDSRKMIMCGYYYGASILDLITIAAFVHVTKRKIFTKDFNIKNFAKADDKYIADDILDDFINCIFVYNSLHQYINDNITTNITLEKIRTFCTSHNLLYDGLLQVIEMRDTIIENMVDIGLDPYYNDLQIKHYNLSKILNTSTFESFNEIKKFKLCLYNGYRCNLLTRVKDTTYTVQKHGIQISVKSNLLKSMQVLPKYIIIDTYNLVQKYNQAQFEFVTQGYVSVLDNFAKVDENFTKF